MCSIQNVDIDVKYSRKNFGGHRTTTRLWKQNPLSDPSGHGPACRRPAIWHFSCLLIKLRFNDGQVIFWQTLWVLDYFWCVFLISALRNVFWCILRRIFDPKLNNGIFSSQKWHFWAKFSFICGVLQKCASQCFKNAFWCLQAHKTHPNYPQTKGFALKHQ